MADKKHDAISSLVSVLALQQKYDDAEKLNAEICSKANSRNENYSHANRFAYMLAAVLIDKGDFTEALLYARRKGLQRV